MSGVLQKEVAGGYRSDNGYGPADFWDAVVAHNLPALSGFFGVLAGIAGMVAMGLTASFLPAQRAASIDPMAALREE